MTQPSTFPVQSTGQLRPICSPGNLQGTRAGLTSLTLTWDEPYATCKLCPNASYYRITGPDIHVEVTRPPYTLTGLHPDQDTLIEVRAVTAEGVSSGPESIRLLRLPPPGKPGVPELSDITDTSATVSWTPASGIDIALRYIITLYGTIVGYTRDCHFTLTGLENHAKHRVEVRAEYEDSGLVSEISQAWFKTLLSPPTGLTFTQHNGLCRLTWDSNPAGPWYEVCINGQIVTDQAYFSYRFELMDQSPGPGPHVFNFEVRAYVEVEYSAVSELQATVLDGVRPTQPGTPVVTDISETSAQLQWTPSSDEDRVGGYRVLVNGLRMFEVQEPALALTGLTGGSLHYIDVRAWDSAGNVSTPATATFKTRGPAPSPPPSAPHVELFEHSATSVLLKWTFVDDESAEAGVKIMLDGHYNQTIFIYPITYVANLSVNVQYTLEVFAFDVYGQLSEPAVLVFTHTGAAPRVGKDQA